jgi:hypothetical protein
MIKGSQIICSTVKLFNPTRMMHLASGTKSAKAFIILATEVLPVLAPLDAEKAWRMLT